MRARMFREGKLIIPGEVLVRIPEVICSPLQPSASESPRELAEKCRSLGLL